MENVTKILKGSNLVHIYIYLFWGGAKQFFWWPNRIESHVSYLYYKSDPEEFSSSPCAHCLC